MDVLSEDIKFMLFVITLFAIAYAPFWAIMNAGLWMPEWIAEPFFTSITQALDKATLAPSIQEYTPPPQPEEASEYILTGIASSGNLTFNISATLELENGIQGFRPE